MRTVIHTADLIAVADTKRVHITDTFKRNRDLGRMRTHSMASKPSPTANKKAERAPIYISLPFERDLTVEILIRCSHYCVTQVIPSDIGVLVLKLKINFPQGLM